MRPYRLHTHLPGSFTLSPHSKLPRSNREPRRAAEQMLGPDLESLPAFGSIPAFELLEEQRSRGLSFGFSMAIHMLAFFALALLWHGDPRGGPEESDRSGSIVLVQNTGGAPEYFASDTAGTNTSSATSAAEAPSQPLPSQDVPPVDLTGVLPSGQSGIRGTGTGIEGAANLLAGASASGKAGPAGGKAKTYVFGVSGIGNKFIYVFDRSASMAGYQGRPLLAAKRELTQSLENLSRTHQFQIIFYNDRTSVFNPMPGQAPRLLWGEDYVKDSAERYVRGITAEGGTKHLPALKLALDMAPDVIFFLTDADDPQLTSAELAEIQRLNRAGTTINTIQFGAGSDPGGDNFLIRLARQNQGKHAYVDVTTLTDEAESTRATSNR